MSRDEGNGEAAADRQHMSSSAGPRRGSRAGRAAVVRCVIWAIWPIGSMLRQRMQMRLMSRLAVCQCRQSPKGAVTEHGCPALDVR